MGTVLASDPGKTGLHVAFSPAQLASRQHPHSAEPSASLAAEQTPGKQEGSLSGAPSG